ncbi:probable E3 SUMO-protein ligase RNF212 isoform X2 [Mustela erminea]|uniref:probable E3 SUMO-protein ligase RNF212 isoform X2 n=1 Tax=Mustela erminea TaxID=36723 RepID=UPI0013874455|nr:probable E3 SUMO-protein ligase RNF212 isoform X2 [Mustela erminea]
MASWVFCNRCFQPPHRTSCFSLTNCGHVYCDVCLGKGGKNECLICKAPCRTVFLSKHTDADIQALFMGIDGLCKKYSRETCQISEFQEKHRKRLLAFYREKITKLEESLRRSALRMEQLQGMRLSQQTAFSAVKTPVSTPSAKPDGHLLLPPDTSASDRVESMQIDHTPSLVRKPEVAVGPARISLISPPQHGRMGSISSCGPQLLGLTPSHSSVSQALRIPWLPVPCRALSQPAAPRAPGRTARGGSPSLGGSQTLAPRPPISISALLQRQRVGKCALH